MAVEKKVGGLEMLVRLCNDSRLQVRAKRNHIL